jgi:hypothetical protein
MQRIGIQGKRFIKGGHREGARHDAAVAREHLSENGLGAAAKPVQMRRPAERFPTFALCVPKCGRRSPYSLNEHEGRLAQPAKFN